MWIVAKIKSKEINIFMENLRNKTCNKIQFYYPKISFNETNTNKKNSKYQKAIISGYLFCFHPIFSSKKIIGSFRNLKGLNYFLTQHLSDQKNIESFINYCKKFENDKGFLSPSFFDRILKDKGQFLSGPFKNLVFDIIEKNKKVLKIQIGNFTTTVKRNNYLYKPV